MGEFEEQWAAFENTLARSLLQINHGYVFHHEAPINPSDGTIRHASFHHDDGLLAILQGEQSEAAAENVSDIFEFFDLANAALDFDGPEPSGQVTHVPSSTPTLTPLTPPNVITVVPELLQAPQMQDLQNFIAGNYPVVTALPVHHDYAPIQPTRIAKRRFQEDSTGAQTTELGVTLSPAKKRKQRTQTQLEGLRKVREHGACLRCHVHKKPCSEGRPCQPCQELFLKNHNSKTLKWTECVSASLPRLNIFAIGIAIFEDEQNGNGSRPKRGLDFKTALPLYNLLFQHRMLPEMTADLNELYGKVLWHTYEQEAKNIHPFILEEKNPLYMLVQLNVILLGSPIIAPELIGRIRYLQKLRAICSVVAFECLGRALDRDWAKKSSVIRKKALIVQVALLLEQVMEMQGDIPAAAVSWARGSVFEEMRRHLIQYLSYYLRKLVSGLSGRGKSRFSRIQETKYQGPLREDFWAILSDIMPSIPLKKPPMLRKYQDISWGACGVEEQALHEHFSAKCSIECN